MESRLLHKSTSYLKGKVKWEGDARSEWISIGQGVSRDFNVIAKLTLEHFGKCDLYLVRERTNSTKVLAVDVISTLEPLIGIENFLLWSIELDKAIEFNRIGVLRRGKVG